MERGRSESRPLLKPAVAVEAEFATRVKGLRGNLGLTQAELAQAVGVGLNTVQRWEAGRGRPRTIALRAVESIEALAGQAKGVLAEGKTGAWLRVRLDSLGGRRPLDVLADPRGVEKVAQLLGQVEWGLLT